MNRLLQRQLKRTAQVDGQAALDALLHELQALAGTAACSPGARHFLLGTGELLRRVSASYDQHARDVELHARSLLLSSEELETAQRELLQLSRTDRMTRLWNRGYWQERLQEEFHRARRYDTLASLLIFDIDHFKRINDRHGHPAGDQVICRVADVLLRHSRQVDICARYGGEEFSVILPGTSEDGALHFAEALRRQTENLDWEADGLPFRVTISLGVAELGAASADVEHWLVLADRALYDAKRSGRNRTCRASESGMA